MFLDLGKAKSANTEYLKIALSRKLSAFFQIELTTNKWVCE